MASEGGARLGGEPLVLRVTVCYPAPGRLWLRELCLAQGATVDDALHQSHFAQEFPGLDVWKLGVGVYGQRIEPDTLLFDGDRVEIYRGLAFDPQESRRRRVEHRRAKQAAEGRKRPPGLL